MSWLLQPLSTLQHKDLVDSTHRWARQSYVCPPSHLQHTTPHVILWTYYFFYSCYMTCALQSARFNNPVLGGQYKSSVSYCVTSSILIFTFFSEYCLVSLWFDIACSWGFPFNQRDRGVTMHLQSKWISPVTRETVGSTLTLIVFSSFCFPHSKCSPEQHQGCPGHVDRQLLIFCVCMSPFPFQPLACLGNC